MKIAEYFKKILFLAKKLYGGQKLQILVLVVLSVLNGFIGSIGFSTLIPLFSFVARAEPSEQDPISKFLISLFSGFGVTPSITTLLIIIAALFVFKAIVLAAFGYIRAKIAIDYELATRRALHLKALSSQWSYLLRQKLGYLEDALSNDIGVASSFLREICSFALHFTSSVIYLATAFFIDPMVTLLAFGFGIVSIAVLKPFMARARAYGQEGNLLKKEIAHQINENVIGAKTIKALDLKNEVDEMVAGYFVKMRNLGLKFRILDLMSSEPMEPLIIIFITSVFAFSYSRPGFQIAAFLVTLYLIKQIMESMGKMRDFIYKSNAAIPHINVIVRLREDLEKYAEEDKGTEKFSFKNTLEFKNVEFDYSPQKKILGNINFSIGKGESLGIMGASGAGKTTIVDLLLRLFDPTSGAILADGKNAKNISLKEWRRNIGYMAQDVFLKNDTIENNIRFYDKEISRDDIEKAARDANIYDFIKTLPKGFESKVGERGVFLSGGERQRIALARVLARNPQILVLDEATSSVDNQSEILIKKAIDNLKGRVTVVMIAHRLSTILDADKAIVLEGGKIIESGAPQQLLADKGSYFYKYYNAHA